MNKQEWIKHLSDKYLNIIHTKVVDGKKMTISDFANSSSPELRQDRHLNALSFNKTKLIQEIPEGMLDFDFIKEVFNIKNSPQVFLLPYEWKDNEEEKEYLKEILTILRERQTDYRSHEMLWRFEAGFWLDTAYTKDIKALDYDYLNLAMVKELNQSKEIEQINCLLDIVSENHYYIKHIKNTHKALLPKEVILNYAKDYGITSLTKEQKNQYEVIEEAFINGHITYDKLDDRWKNKESLVRLLNHKEVWLINNETLNISQLTPELLSDKEVITSCISYGYNLLELKNTPWYQDKELKLLALKTYASDSIIIDAIDDKDLVLAFLKNINTRDNLKYSGINLFEQTKRIPTNLFEDKEVMAAYLSIKGLDNDAFFCANATKAFSQYDIDDLLDFIDMNKEVYKVLPDDKKQKWELSSLFYERNKGSSNKMPPTVLEAIKNLGSNYENNILEVKKFAFQENLERTLENKPKIKQSKI